MRLIFTLLSLILSFASFSRVAPGGSSTSTYNSAEISAREINLGKWNDFPTTNTPGPITGLQFSVTKSDSGVVLNWSTQTETNSSRFEVQRSSSARDGFKKIGETTAAGNSEIQRAYQLNDKHPAGGTNYYRIKKVDVDGKYSLSNVKVVVMPSAKIQLSPDPAEKYINISLPADTSNGAKITIIDKNGQPVANASAMQHQQIITIDVSALAKGRYTAQVETGGKTKKIKFLKK